MKIFRCGLYPYLLCSFILFLGMFTFIHYWDDLIGRLVVGFGLVCTLVGIIELISLRFILGTEKITQKSLFRKSEELYFDKIEHIVAEPDSKINKPVVSLYGQDKKIDITFWIKNHKDLLKLIVDSCLENGKTSIDKKVIDIVNCK